MMVFALLLPLLLPEVKGSAVGLSTGRSPGFDICPDGLPLSDRPLPAAREMTDHPRPPLPPFMAGRAAARSAADK